MSKLCELCRDEGSCGTRPSGPDICVEFVGQDEKALKQDMLYSADHCRRTEGAESFRHFQQMTRLIRMSGGVHRAETTVS